MHVLKWFVRIFKIKMTVQKIINKIFAVIKLLVIKNNVVKPMIQLPHIKGVKILWVHVH